MAPTDIRARRVRSSHPKPRPKKKPKKPKVKDGFQGVDERSVVNQTATLLFNLAPRFLRLIRGFQDAMEQHPWFYAGVSATSRNVAGVPFVIRTGDRKDPEVVEEGEWVDLFERVNPHMDEAMFKEALVVHLETSGHVVVVLESKTDARVKPDEIPFELWPISGKLFEPAFKKDSNGLKTNVVLGWDLRMPGSSKKVFYANHELVHIRYFNKNEPLRGLAPLDALEITVRSDWKAMIFDEAFLDNGANPGGWLISEEELSDEEYDQEISQFEDRHTGVGKAGRIEILEGGKQFVPNPVTQKDMQFREKREWSRDEILGALGVPKSEVGVEQPTNMITNAGRLSTNHVFWTNKLSPLMEKVASAFWGQLMKRVTDSTIWLDWDWDAIVALKPALGGLLTDAEAMQRLGVPMTDINERLELGLPHREHYDIALVPAGMVPVDALFLPDDEFDILAELEDELDEVGQEMPVALQMDSPQFERTRRVVEKFFRDRDKDLEGLWRKVAAGVMDPFEPRFRGRFRKYLMALRADQLRRLKKLNIPEPESKAVRQGTVAEVMFEREKWDRILKRAERPIYFQAALASIDQADDETERAARVPKGRRPEIAKQVADRRVRVLVKANENIQKRLARQIEIGIRKGETIPQIAKRVRRTFTGVSRKWSFVVARTEISSVVNEARVTTMQENGVEAHRWVTADDEVVRASHRINEEQGPVPIGARFSNGLRFPLDVGPPSEVVNCRCITVPVRVF